MSRKRPQSQVQPSPVVPAISEVHRDMAEGALTITEIRELRQREELPAPSCENCAYWLPIADVSYDGSYGVCRRYPPQHVDPSHLTASGSICRFSLTLATTVCGEHPRFKS